MADCGCAPTLAETSEQRRILWIALALNAMMFAVEVAVGTLINSTSLVADGLDMLSDASVYAIAITAIGRGARFKGKAAIISGLMLLVLGIGLIIDVIRRLEAGGSPEGIWMVAVSLPALLVNVVVLRLLARQRSEEIHMRAAWIFTRADVVANVAVIAAGLAVLATQIRYIDLVVGASIGLYVVKEALEILKEARTSRTEQRSV